MDDILATSWYQTMHGQEPIFRKYQLCRSCGWLLPLWKFLRLVMAQIATTSWRELKAPPRPSNIDPKHSRSVSDCPSLHVYVRLPEYFGSKHFAWGTILVGAPRVYIAVSVRHPIPDLKYSSCTLECRLRCIWCLVLELRSNNWYGEKFYFGCCLRENSYTPFEYFSIDSQSVIDKTYKAM